MNNNNSNCYTLRVCSSFAAKRVKQETQIFRMYSQTFVHILHRLDISVFLRTVGEGKSLGISTRTSGLSRSLIIERQDLSIPRSTHTHTHTHTHRGECLAFQLRTRSIQAAADRIAIVKHRRAFRSAQSVWQIHIRRGILYPPSLPVIRPLATRTTDKRRLIPIYVDTLIPIRGQSENKRRTETLIDFVKVALVHR